MFLKVIIIAEITIPAAMKAAIVITAMEAVIMGAATEMTRTITVKLERHRKLWLPPIM